MHFPPSERTSLLASYDVSQRRLYVGVVISIVIGFILNCIKFTKPMEVTYFVITLILYSVSTFAWWILYQNSIKIRFSERRRKSAWMPLWILVLFAFAVPYEVVILIYEFKSKIGILVCISEALFLVENVIAVTWVYKVLAGSYDLNCDGKYVYLSIGTLSSIFAYFLGNGVADVATSWDLPVSSIIGNWPIYHSIFWAAILPLRLFLIVGFIDIWMIGKHQTPVEDWKSHTVRNKLWTLHDMPWTGLFVTFYLMLTWANFNPNIPFSSATLMGNMHMLLSVLSLCLTVYIWYWWNISVEDTLKNCRRKISNDPMHGSMLLFFAVGAIAFNLFNVYTEYELEDNTARSTWVTAHIIAVIPIVAQTLMVMADLFSDFSDEFIQTAAPWVVALNLSALIVLIWNESYAEHHTPEWQLAALAGLSALCTDFHTHVIVSASTPLLQRMEQLHSGKKKIFLSLLRSMLVLSKEHEEFIIVSSQESEFPATAPRESQLERLSETQLKTKIDEAFYERAGADLQVESIYLIANYYAGCEYPKKLQNFLEKSPNSRQCIREVMQQNRISDKDIPSLAEFLSNHA